VHALTKKKNVCRFSVIPFDEDIEADLSGPEVLLTLRIGETTMRVMVIVKANKESEAGALPSAEILTKMGKYNEELVKAGVMLAGEGLKASSHGKRVKFSGEQRTVSDGPFAETKELIAG